MALPKMVEWARQEWGIFAKRQEMGMQERVRWLRQWVPFGARTVGYGTLSITLGPLSDGAASVWAARKWSAASAKGLRIQTEIHGVEHVPSGGFVYASNHQSLVDILVLGATLPGDFKWAAKRAVMNVPFLGWHLRLAGHVPVDRKQGVAAAESVANAFENVLRDDKPLLAFPEGTRSEDGQVKPFKKGVFIAAVRTGCPVVPVALEGTFSLMSRDQVDTGTYRAPEAERKVLIQLGAPIEPDAKLPQNERIVDLMKRTEAEVVRLHAELCAKRKGA